MSVPNIYSLKGRRDPRRFAYKYAVILLLLILLGYLEHLVNPNATANNLFESFIVMVLFVVHSFFCFTLFAVTAQRFHDFNKSGWWSLLLFIPLMPLFLPFYLYFKKGDVGANQYGPDPLD